MLAATIKKLDRPLSMAEDIDYQRDVFGGVDIACNAHPVAYSLTLEYDDYEIKLIGHKFVGEIRIFRGEITAFEFRRWPVLAKRISCNCYISNPEEVYEAVFNGFEFEAAN